MRFYFSGVSGRSELEMLREAGAVRLLADPFDLRHLAGERRSVVLDTGAYKIWKSRESDAPLSVGLDEYERVATTEGPFDFVVSPDEIGDPARTRDQWLEMRRRGLQRRVTLVPVWQFGASDDLLRAYAEESRLIGIGGLVPFMREKDEGMLRALKKVCALYPGRVHIFGLAWMKALNHLFPLIASGDSSHWLVGARKGRVVTVNDRGRKPFLSEAHASRLGLQLTRRERCVESARAILRFTDVGEDRYEERLAA